MNIDILNFLVEAMGVLIVGLITALFSYFFPRLQTWFGKPSEQGTPPQETFSQRLEKLTENLASASEDFDKVLGEMNQVAHDRKLALTSLELQVVELSQRELEMKKKVNELEKVSIPALEYFLQASEKSEKRSAKRDYLLFIAGVIVSAIVSIIFRFTLGI